MSASAPGRPHWRSAMYVPVNMDRFVDKAHTRGADAIVLDLEDSVPPAEKETARERLADAVAKVSRSGADVVVRVNSPWRLAVRDLEASVISGVRAIMAPKAESEGQMLGFDEVIQELETERGLPLGGIGIIAEIETVAAMFQASAIAASCERMLSVFVGGEDFSLSAGMEAHEDSLAMPSYQVSLAGRAVGLMALGYLGSVADYQDLEAFRQMVRRSRQLGFRGGFAIHPAQVAILNEEFMPTDAEVAHARAVVEAFEAAMAQGRGSVAVDGMMIDKPVVNRARGILAWHQRFARKAE